MNFLSALTIPFLLAASLPATAQSYWQQEVNTHIDVRLDDRTHFLHGYEALTYINHSPDTLRYIYIHLWPNAYKNDHTAFAEQKGENGDTKFYYAPAADRGYIDSLQFVINGSEADYYHADNTPDVARIDLKEPLPPGGTLNISTPFRVKIPKVFSRMGHTGRAYFISQWFPKPAVYDQKGWHPLPYLDYGEFYSNIGSYDVSITLPQNYVVMATGNCTDASENEWLDSLSRKPLPPDTLWAKSWPKSAEELKTLHYHEDHVHDFAWFADKRWIVRKDTVTIPGNPDAITAYTAFLPQHRKEWIKGTGYLRATVQHYSDYAGPYPYKTIKAVEGDMKAGGGMEYPTVTVIDRDAIADLRTVIVHEAGHNWFYGILATNERDHAWMDEGINSFYERKTVHALKGYDKYDFILPADRLNDVAYYEQAVTRNDQALEQTSANFTGVNYGADVYYKTSLMLSWLESYMGKENFKAGMHDYFNTWKFRHPYPEDFKAVMQKHTTKPIDWFFDGSLQTDQPVDFKIMGVSRSNGETAVTVRNKSDFAAPAGLIVYQGDSLLQDTWWSEPFSGSTTIKLPASIGDWTRIKITGAVPDAKTSNNYYRRYGLFHRGGIKPAAFIGLNMGSREKQFLSPAIGYNNYDGFQLGLLLHNLTWPETRFHYAIAPTYGFTSEGFTGAGAIGYSWYPKHTFHEILLQLDAKTYHYDETDVNIREPLFARYMKIAPSLSFVFKEKEARSTVKRTLTLKAYSISEDYFDFKMDPADSLYKPSVKQQQKYYGLLRYMHNNTRTYNPFSYAFEGQLGADYAKLTAEGNFRIDYHKKNKALHVRAFAGKFFTINNDPYAAERYYLNTTYTGVNDYLYDDTYIGRSERDGFAGRQISIREGGFKIPTLFQNPVIGRNDNWLVTVNLKTDLPFGRLPVRLYLDAGTFADAANKNPSGNKFLYEGGVEVYLPFHDLISVYVPLVMSKDFSDYMKSIYGNKQFEKSIVFSLNLQNINWLKTPSKVLQTMAGM